MTSLTWIKLDMFENGENYSICLETTEVRNDKTGRILKQCYDKGYKRVYFSLNGKKKFYRVHQLLWISQNGHYDKTLYDIDHINHVRDDNRLENLRLVSKSVNCINKSHQRGRLYEFYDELPDAIVFDEEYEVYFCQTFDKFFRKVIEEYREVFEYKDKRCKNYTYIEFQKNNKRKRLGTTKFRRNLK